MKPKWFVAGIGAVLVIVGVVIGFAVTYSAEYEGTFGGDETASCGSAWNRNHQLGFAGKDACDDAVNSWLPWPFIVVGLLIIAGAFLVKWNQSDTTKPRP